MFGQSRAKQKTSAPHHYHPSPTESGAESTFPTGSSERIAETSREIKHELSNLRQETAQLTKWIKDMRGEDDDPRYKRKQQHERY